MREKFNIPLVTDAVSTVYALGDLEPAIKKYLGTDPTATVTEVISRAF